MRDATSGAGRPQPALRWWREVAYIAIFYVIYTFVRNQFGSAQVSPQVAYHHATQVVSIEERLHLFWEQQVQSAFIGWRQFIRFWNVYYGSVHFVATFGALAWCYVRTPERYRVWRNTLASTTALALVGFSLYPLMPPRLLNDMGRYGAGAFATRDYGFVDTLKAFGGLWSFDTSTLEKISNQYAAMPSLHCAWATWVVLVMWPAAKRPLTKALLVGYPIATLFCIVVTANHYWLDGVGGLAVLAIGYQVGSRLARWSDDRAAARAHRYPDGYATSKG